MDLPQLRKKPKTKLTDFFSSASASTVKSEPKTQPEPGVNVKVSQECEIINIEDENDDINEITSTTNTELTGLTDASTVPTSITLYGDLLSLSFPCPPSMVNARKFEFMNIKSSNHTKPLIERRATSSNVKLHTSKLKPYQDWIVIGDSGAVCKACKLFLPCHLVPKKHGKFLSKPWTAFNRIQDVKDHAENDYHKESMFKMTGYRSRLSGETVPVTRQLDMQKQRDYEKKKRRLYAVIRALVFCARGGVALRGHRNESLPIQGEYHETAIKGGVNRGNFISTLTLMRDSGDENVDVFINKKCMYTSHTIQDELLERISTQLTKQIVDKVNRSSIYTIIADETRDNSNTEVLCVALRFFDYEKGQPNEKFLTFLPLESLKGAALASAILDVLEAVMIPISNCIGQSYDGASNMSGHVSGTSAIILEKNPRARYSHCKSHKLNLSLVKSCTTVQPINNMMGTLTEVCSFFSLSPKRQRKLTAVIKADDSSSTPATKMVKLSQTRWVERYKALEVGVSLLPYLVETLIQMVDSEEYRSDWSQASSLLRSITTFQYIYSLFVCREVMNSTKILTKQLQGRNMTVANSGSAIDGTGKQIQSYRRDVETYNELWYKETVDLAKKIGVSPSVPRQCGRQRHRDNPPSSNPEQFYLRTVLIPFLDILSCEYDKRFGSSVGLYPSLNILPSAIVSDHWKGKLEEWRETVANSLSEYSDLLPSPLSLLTELTTWRLHWLSNQSVQSEQRSGGEDSDGELDEPIRATDSITKSYKVAEELCLGNVAAVLKILACLPVTSCEAERSFSRLALLKTDIRSTMSYERLNSLSVISIHRDLEIDVDVIAKQFLAARE